MNLTSLSGYSYSEFGYHGIGYDMIGPGCCDGPGGLFSTGRPKGMCCLPGYMGGQGRMAPGQGSPPLSQPGGGGGMMSRVCPWCC